MPPVPPGREPKLRRINWSGATRIVASRHPPIDLFERVSADPAVWDALIAAAALVDPRVRDEVGEIRLVPPQVIGNDIRLLDPSAFGYAIRAPYVRP